ncbi:hypothetical protein JXL19_08585 [bacterium]|nr:hypothetical protein [bacterium]
MISKSKLSGFIIITIIALSITSIIAYAQWTAYTGSNPYSSYNPYFSYGLGNIYSGFGVSGQYGLPGYGLWGSGAVGGLSPIYGGFGNPGVYGGFNWGQPYNLGLIASSPSLWGNPGATPWGNNLWNNPLVNPWGGSPWQTYSNYMWPPQSYSQQWPPGYTAPNYGWQNMSPPYFSYPPYDPTYPRNPAYAAGISGNISDEDIDDEEYLVYSALIKAKYNSNNILILKHTYTGSLVEEPDYNYLKGHLTGLEISAVQDYLAKNSKWYYLDDDFDLDDYELVPLDTQMLYNVVRLSRVGFNSGLNQAFVYAERAEASLAGAGYYYLLAKEDGVWKVKSQIQLWIS